MPDLKPIVDRQPVQESTLFISRRAGREFLIVFFGSLIACATMVAFAGTR